MLRAAGILLCFCAFAQDAPKPQMTARELFYSAAQTPAPPPAPKPPVVAHKTTKNPPAQSAGAQPKPPAPVPPAPPGDNALPGGAKFITVAAGMPTSAPPPANGTPLGLKYSLLKLTGGQMEEVPTDTMFHSGDRIQFNVETNGPGYLYLISQGSSGNWKPMFPSPEIEGGNNRVEGFRNYTLPPRRMFFDDQAGTEKLFLVFTREKEADLENMIYSLQGGKAKPVAAPARVPEPAPEVLRASIDDRAVGRLRTTYARDLIIEAVDPSTPGGQKKESAVYVVNPTGSPDSKLVVDLLLVHK